MNAATRNAIIADINFLTAAYKATKDEADRATILGRIYRREAELRG